MSEDYIEILYKYINWKKFININPYYLPNRKKKLDINNNINSLTTFNDGEYNNFIDKITAQEMEMGDSLFGNWRDF